ncbi:MAG TPA: hypothetical protein VM680_01285 [Verrucomicrobiae bacterium]|nr:hypothetical protein [Verrucomicrobiae bacterium]
MVHAQAAVLWYEAKGAFTKSDFPAAIAVGDQFSALFSYEDSVTDTNSSTLAGRFGGALLHFEFHLLPGALGNYLGGSTTSFRPVDTFDGVGEGPAAVPDRFYIAATGGNFGPLNGHPFGGLLLVLDDYTHTSSIRDTGAGKTLNAQLGGILNLQQFKTTLLRVSPEGKNGVAEANITSLEIRTAPALAVTKAAAKLRFAWSANEPNYVIESTLSLEAPNWQKIDGTPVVEGSEIAIVIEPDSANRFFRLRSE